MDFRGDKGVGEEVDAGGIDMQLTNEMKEKVEKAQSKEEVKKILEDAGVTLDDVELDQVAGGLYFGGGKH